MEVARSALHTAQTATWLQLSPDRQGLIADGGDLIHVGVQLLDENDVLNPLQEANLTVTIERPAVLQALGSASPATEEDFRGPTGLTFAGQALAIVQSTAQDGDLRVTISAAGFASATALLCNGGGAEGR